MLIIADYRIPEQIRKNLQALGEVALLQTEGVVYDSISGHPDIFLCKTPNQLIVAPETPSYIIEKLKLHNIPFSFGKKHVGNAYPKTVPYNAVVTNQYLIHQTDFTDESILALPLQKIKIPQGYAQCNIIPLKDNSFIVSDKGIEKQLKLAGIETYYFAPQNIRLYQQKHGFLGGCCGQLGEVIYFSGLLTIPNKDELEQVLISKGYKIIWLSDLPLTDYGGFFFLNPTSFE